eukprot:6178402-Pleurochrysis_carterae.AAC.2
MPASNCASDAEAAEPSSTLALPLSSLCTVGRSAACRAGAEWRLGLGTGAHSGADEAAHAGEAGSSIDGCEAAPALRLGPPEPPSCCLRISKPAHV